MKEPKEVKRWMGTPPVKCDLCDERLTLTNGHVCFYDFKTIEGYWAIGCAKCFRLHGGLMGKGLGQKYRIGDLTKMSH